MTLLYETDLCWVKINQYAECKDQASFRSQFTARTHRQTYTRQTNRTTRTTKLFGEKNSRNCKTRRDFVRSEIIRRAIAASAAHAPPAPDHVTTGAVCCIMDERASAKSTEHARTHTHSTHTRTVSEWAQATRPAIQPLDHAAERSVPSDSDCRRMSAVDRAEDVTPVV